MKSKSRVKGYKEGTEDWKAEYNMLLDDGITCNNCAYFSRCKTSFGTKRTDEKCQFYPTRYFPNFKQQRNKLKSALESEKESRIYYQNIVYEICDILDGAEKSKIVCGTHSDPSTELQERIKELKKK